MNAKPARRRKSSLAGQHPAIPPEAVPAPTPQPAPTSDEDPAPTPAPALAPVSVTELPSSLAAAHERSPAPVRTRDEDDARAEQARARTDARDVAYGWGSARRKLDRKTREWIAALNRARALGALPGVLGDYVREGAVRAGIDPSEVPAEVWRAAGLDHPQA